jgi:lipid-A-disaccharide synthase
MANLIAGKQIVPELVQKDFTAERVAGEVSRITEDGNQRAMMQSNLKEVRARLMGGLEGEHPAERTARRILSMIGATQLEA